LFTPGIVITLICLAVFLFLTFGWQNVGAAYVLRGLVRGDAVFVWSDFFYAIKRNFKQAFFMGLFDAACIVILVVDFIFFHQRTGSYGLDVMYFVIFTLIVLYIIMRFYLYQLLITFDLSNFKILKNALIFTVLGIKRNILALIGIILLLVLHIALIILLLPLGITVPIVLPLVYAIAVLGFMQTYASYPVIDRYMIAPYMQESPTVEGAFEEEFVDEN